MAEGGIPGGSYTLCRLTVILKPQSPGITKLASLCVAGFVAVGEITSVALSARSRIILDGQWDRPINNSGDDGGRSQIRQRKRTSIRNQFNRSTTINLAVVVKNMR